MSAACLAASPLLCIFLLFVHHEVCFSEVLGEDPSHTCSRAVWESLVLCLHACAPDGVGVFLSDSGDVVITGHGALEALMVDIIAARKTVAKV